MTAQLKELIQQNISKVIDGFLAEENSASTLSQYILRKKQIESSSAILPGFNEECKKNEIYLIFLETLKNKLGDSKLSTHEKNTLTNMIQWMEECAKNENIIETMQKPLHTINELNQKELDCKTKYMEENQRVKQNLEDYDQRTKTQEDWSLLAIPSTVIAIVFSIFAATLPATTAPALALVIVLSSLAAACGLVAIGSWIKVSSLSAAANALLDKVNQGNQNCRQLEQEIEGFQKGIKNQQEIKDTVAPSISGSVAEKSIDALQLLKNKVDDCQKAAEQASTMLTQEPNTAEGEKNVYSTTPLKNV